MSTNAEPLIVRYFHEVWNRGRRDAIREMVTPDCVLHDGASYTVGLAPIEAFHESFQTEFSKIQITPHEVITQGDLSCFRWTADMEHQATGKQVTVTGITMARTKDGRIAEGWQVWDRMAMVEQLGAPPAALRVTV